LRKLLFMLPLLLLFAAANSWAHDDIEKPKSCQQCGMDRIAYAHSRMLIVFADGTRVGTCSLNCTANELKEHQGKKVESLQVADYDFKKLIDARKATWVIGGSKPGVMTSTPKWAFASKEGAQRFITANGGKLAVFDEALAMEQED